MAIYGSQTSRHCSNRAEVIPSALLKHIWLWKIRSSKVNIFCLEHFYTIRYDTFFHTFLCSTTYQKLVFYAGIPLNIWS